MSSEGSLLAELRGGQDPVVVADGMSGDAGFPVTPQAIERRLLDLGRELDEAHEDLVDAETEYFSAKAGFEILIAKARMGVAARLARSGVKATVQEKEDAALVECEEQVVVLAAAEARVRGSRANVVRVRTQIDIARSVGTAVRASLELA